MSFSYASVVETSELNSRLRRITLQIDDPGALALQPAGDSAVGVYFPIVTGDGERTPHRQRPVVTARAISTRNRTRPGATTPCGSRATAIREADGAVDIELTGTHAGNLRARNVVIAGGLDPQLP
jgi:hypothetical protein